MIDITKIKMHVMKISDLEEIKDNLYKDFDDLWTYEIFKEELEHNNLGYIVARYEDEIVCFGGIKTILGEAELMNIVTRKDMRGNGFATFVLNSLIDIAKNIGCTKIHLEVNQNNTTAIKLYRFLGFKQDGIRKNYYNNKTENAILMTLKI